MKYSDLNNIVSSTVNISEKERLISGIAGGLFLALGVFDFSKSSFRRALRMTAGSLLIIRGVTGYCPWVAITEADGKVDKEEKSPSLISG